MREPRLCIFGEVLFDHFPDGARVLGGAPFNVAWHLHAFGQDPYFVSRLGDDADGAGVLAAMRAWGMDTDGVQIDAKLPTGRVSVSFHDGEPDYDIVHPSAWDAIEPLAAPPPIRLLYHGSLALRNETSRAALAALKAQTPDLIFLDVNLRRPWWDVESVLAEVRDAHWVKLNAEELELLHPEADARAFMAAHDLRGLILTHGGEGAEVLTIDGSRFIVKPVVNDAVVDTVGAGDAFASVMILGLASGWPLPATAERAQAFASRIVGQRGATVDAADFYAPLRRDWRL
ncbi:MAG: carbohydrate kinase [Chromatiales bacterium]|nr:carbohydrate kinase [Gammaproteobacteria bacterium]MCP5351658.1 carbohydrate kinase [Chromatiales bacterium]